MVSIVACIYSVWFFRIFTILPLGDPNRNDASLSDHIFHPCCSCADADTTVTRGLRKNSEISHVLRWDVHAHRNQISLTCSCHAFRYNHVIHLHRVHALDMEWQANMGLELTPLKSTPALLKLPHLHMLLEACPPFDLASELPFRNILFPNFQSLPYLHHPNLTPSLRPYFPRIR